MTIAKFVGAAAAAVILCAGALPAEAKTVKPASYIGTWGTSLAECKNPLSDKNGPAVLTEKDYSQAQTHCTFGPLSYRNYAWHTKVVCDVAGTKQDDTRSIAVSGDALMLVWGKSHATVDYARCGGGAAGN